MMVRSGLAGACVQPMSSDDQSLVVRRWPFANGKKDLTTGQFDVGRQIFLAPNIGLEAIQSRLGGAAEVVVGSRFLANGQGPTANDDFSEDDI